MNNIDFSNIFNDNETNKDDNLSKQFNIKGKEEESSNEARISHKLTLRKQKLQKIIINKRFLESNNYKIGNMENSREILYKKEEFLSGKVYDDLNNAYNLKNENELRNILYRLILFLNDENIDNMEFINIMKKSDSSYNISNNIKNDIFPLAMLLLDIGLNTNDNIIYHLCFNLLLNLSYKSHDFCLGITNEVYIKKIIEKFIKLYPIFEENKKENNNNIIFLNNIEKAESYNVGNQILQLLGNLFLSSNTYKPFEDVNFYEKIFYLFSVFNLDYDNKNYLSIRFDYLDTLIWLIYTFYIKVENLAIKYYDYLINIIPDLLKYVRTLYYTNGTELLYKILYLIENLSDINEKFIQKIVESDGLLILNNLFGYLFNTDKDNCEIILTPELSNSIIIIFVNIFSIDSQYLNKLDFNQFAVVYEKLFSIYKMHHSNHYDIQKNLLLVLSNIACFNDINYLIKNILTNNRIIKDLFKYYYNYHKLDILLFIDNIMVKQPRPVRDFILNMGAFDIIKNSIYDYDGDKNEVVEGGIKALYDLIKAEEAYNIRFLFEKLYNTSIPDKIKEIAFNQNLAEDIEEITKLIIIDLEKYEKSLEN